MSRRDQRKEKEKDKKKLTAVVPISLVATLATSGAIGGGKKSPPRKVSECNPTSTGVDAFSID